MRCLCTNNNRAFDGEFDDINHSVGHRCVIDVAALCYMLYEYVHHSHRVKLAQLVKASVEQADGQRFEPHLTPNLCFL